MTAAATFELDQQKMQAFAGRVLDLITGGGVSLAISVGHRTRLFDVLADLPPSTSAQIAEKAKLDERYVREWLAVMVTSRIIDFDPKARAYRLPAEHAAFLTRAASPNNLAVTAEFVAVLGSAEDKIVHAFQHGGGPSYADYHRFHEVMAEQSAQIVVSGLVSTILPLMPGITKRLEQGIDVLDVGCGLGRALIALAKAYPRSRFRGYELVRENVETARAEAARARLPNLTFEVLDLSRLDESARYDLVTAFDIVHDQAAPAAVLRNIRRALRDDGWFLMQDMAAHTALEDNLESPLAALLYSFSLMHCMSVSLGQGGAGLGTCWGRELAERMLADAGFGQVEVKQLPLDILNYYYIAKA